MAADLLLTAQVEALNKYEAGFITDIESDRAPKGLNEDIIRFISAKKKSRSGCLRGGCVPMRIGRKCLNHMGQGTPPAD